MEVLAMWKEGRQYKILLVEQDDFVRRFCEEVLKQHGYAVVATSSGEDAIRVFTSEEAIDLVLTDYRMGGMDGLELAKMVKAVRPDMPVVLHTGGARFGQENPPFVDMVIYKPTRLPDFMRFSQLIER